MKTLKFLLIISTNLMKNNFPLINAQKKSHKHENFVFCKILPSLDYKEVLLTILSTTSITY